MCDSSENKPKKHICAALLAHVDAGKTTLSEGMLYLSGQIRSLGRVDHKDTFLDSYSLEKERGITIFSKQAQFKWKNTDMTLLDTPGHVDFSAEMERTLSVLDYAILVISGSEGIQGHTRTLWKLLGEYNIPVFIFVNKMDLSNKTKEELLEEITTQLGGNCVDFSDMNLQSESEKYNFYDSLAMCEEDMLEQFIEKETIDDALIIEAIINRQVFPCLFGSALKMEGIDLLLDCVDRFSRIPHYREQFGARVFKILRDGQNGRLTFVKITGGKISVKDEIEINDDKQSGVNNKRIFKIDQIRKYNGDKYELLKEAEAGMICALTGLDNTKAGQGLGIEDDLPKAVLEAVLNYKLILPDEVSPVTFLVDLRRLEEEEPQLNVTWNEKLKEIHVQVMGEIQIEILKSIILERFGIEVEFGAGGVVYKETISEKVEGVGHYEPLRHYAEVHLMLEPLPNGSGIEFAVDVSDDILDKNWQRLVMTHLMEKEHVGVLTGSPITDMKITLVNGRAHLKHTEGGDFRQATYRAVRNGLKYAKSVLLEPYYSFVITLPSDKLGRAMTDIGQMDGKFDSPEIVGDEGVIKGIAPVSSFFGYPITVSSYTGGKGRVTYRFDGYRECHNADQVIDEINYDSESDLDNPTGSVFCSHGAGFNVAWDEVEKYMHIPKRKIKTEQYEVLNESRKAAASKKYASAYEQDKELEDIFVRTFGEIKRKRSTSSGFGYEKELKDKNRDIEIEQQKKQKHSAKQISKREEFLLVDGYNIIFSWKELNELSKIDLSAARDALIDKLCNYQGYKKCNLILVFDAYKVKGNKGEIVKYNNIDVVYTKEAETADMYIEKTAHKLGRDNYVRVATSDGLEQMIIIGQGAVRMSARELENEIEETNKSIRERLNND